jgi:toxin-antitoxin system PIN domain toxin
MILPDINLLVYAHNADAPFHQPALTWWQSTLRSGKAVAIAWVVALGFIRLLSNPRVVKQPVPLARLVHEIQRWLALSHVSILNPGPRHLELLEELLGQAGTTVSLTTDAHLAALAIEHGCVLHSNDQDFTRFDRLAWKNPLDKL